LSDRLGGESWRPAVDVYETDTAVIVELELAGVRQEDLRVNVDGERLAIRGTRAPARDATVQRLHQVEIATGPFERVLRVAIPFERERVSARLVEGLLRVVLPKRGPTPIKIEVGEGSPGKS
jgi:HSP20 family protein